MNIKEIIVVEGKSDTVAVKRATNADTIETNGSAINEETLSRIQHAAETRGVIVFTDPDYPGRRIRAIIEERIPTVKHAFLEKKKTIAKNGKGLGIEHATDDDIRQAIQSVYTVEEQPAVEIPLIDLMAARLVGHPDARKRRERLSELLHIGQVNGKGLKKRLEMFRITPEQLANTITVLDKEEKQDE
ncbi:ribonuclease M5 [Sporosarcina pasteurii]|uniref:Ribonuclease M5 n=1 Tax=Sporosarcina pasteurii TaxID=1474 RepID=A0A380BBV5_SPOPA|nr:ribonuclease M5 [Sporosarcina pasteurii]MDS9473302.1 ribonuclease M5 [Sporosarcina pasteurii]QBQ06532.1 ribonuclease M5 [Sporosarcina pasteurii]SUI98227.1 DNA primase (bacterial type) [Sporosarcina pasteurii]